MQSVRAVLPPISSLTGDMPIIELDLDVVRNTQSPPLSPSTCVPMSQIQLNPNYTKGKPTTFTVLEDISILRAMRMYLGPNIPLKIPWNFWQLYRKFSGSLRSDSSLYHHWNGAMIKKYGNLIKEGRIDECIRWAESSLDIKSSKAEPQHESDKGPVESRALIHTQSYQSIPPALFKNQLRGTSEGQNSRQLTHFNSLQEFDYHDLFAKR